MSVADIYLLSAISFLIIIWEWIQHKRISPGVHLNIGLCYLVLWLRVHLCLSFSPTVSCLARCDRQRPRSPGRVPPKAAASRRDERAAGARRRPRCRHLPAGAAAGRRILQTPPLPLPPMWWHRGRTPPQPEWLRPSWSLHTVQTT